MKVRSIIVEDELPARITIKSYLKRFFNDIEVVAEVDNIADALHLFKKADIDLVFLDVQLKDGKGTEILEHIDSSKFRIVFTTAYEEFAIEAFKHGAFGYLLKPLDPSDFKKIVTRVLNDIHSDFKPSRSIKISLANGSIWVNLNDIIRCESTSNYTKMYCLNDPKPIMLSKTLKLVEEKIIASEDFFRTHQSHLINLRHLKTKSIQNNFVTLTDGSKIPVARSRKSILEDYFLEKKNS